MWDSQIFTLDLYIQQLVHVPKTGPFCVYIQQLVHVLKTGPFSICGSYGKKLSKSLDHWEKEKERSEINLW